MTVKELRKLLECYPDDMEVAIPSMDLYRDYQPLYNSIVDREVHVIPSVSEGAGWLNIEYLDKGEYNPTSVCKIIVMG